MARQRRVVVPGMPMHVIQRGHNRAVTFRDPDEFLDYRRMLHEASLRYRCAIHAYVLMSNHVHLLLTPADERGAARMMQLLGQRFVRLMNQRHQRTGTLWEGRFRSSVVDSERYVLACARYIELNPVRAGMVGDPEQYPWSSHRHNAYGAPDPLITAHPLFASLGQGPREQRAAYRELFAEPLAPPTVGLIRQSVNAGEVLGDAAFRESVEAVLRRPMTHPA